MVVAYDGAQFRGMAENDGVPTVARALRGQLERVAEHPVIITIAGRTDAGVHAWGQVVSFDIRADRADPVALARVVNMACVPAIVVRECEIAANDFDARFSARSRSYRYTVINRPLPDPFLAPTTWWVPQPIDVKALHLGCDPLIGGHDFSSFCRKPKTDLEFSMIRRVRDARWHELGDGILRFDIEANAFCHQMVRSIVGTLVDMGRGRLRPGEMATILAARDRSLSGVVAPAQGLCLWEVGFGEVHPETPGGAGKSGELPGSGRRP